MATATATLPTPDRYGNYWLGDRVRDTATIPGLPGFPAGCAIMPGKIVTADKEVVSRGDWFICLGYDRGMLWVRNRDLRRFRSPQEALQTLVRELRR